MYKKILVTTDGSKHAIRTVIHALELAKRCGGTVTALHVIEGTHPPRSISSPASLLLEEQIEKLKEEGREVVEQVVRKGKEMGVEVIPVVLDGHPAHEILEHGKDFDLIVVGTLGKSGIAHLLLGSVAEKVVRHATVPVLVVK
jgi:nucleotide-binding universal stress UspA family protein